MRHDSIIGTPFKGNLIAGLLVGPVSTITAMLNRKFTKVIG
ncbi:MAG: hypothetical protein P8130_10275 [Deltaproteobacteria bacterium]